LNIIEHKCEIDVIEQEQMAWRISLILQHAHLGLYMNNFSWFNVYTNTLQIK